MNAREILQRMDAGLPVSRTELGYLLPQLEKSKAADLTGVGRCHGKILARGYSFRGKGLLWVTGSRGHPARGTGAEPPQAYEISPNRRPTGTLADMVALPTSCKRCGTSWHFFLSGPMTITAVAEPPVQFSVLV